MSWRLRIVHQTEYRYSDEVHASYNEARVTPAAGVKGSPLEHRVEVDPPAHLFRYRDHWGTIVHAFDVHRPHRSLVVTGSSLIETAPQEGVGDVGPSWEELVTSSELDELSAYLGLSRFVDQEDAVTELSTALRRASPFETVLEVLYWIRDTMRYERGATTVSTTAAECLEARQGVCQDFAHLAIALLRDQHIPARYASGYLYPAVDAPIGETRTGESHAWFEAWLGEWRAFDPTNAGEVGERHVPVGYGRDYGDVPPLKGIIHGGSTESVAVTVEATRLA